MNDFLNNLQNYIAQYEIEKSVFGLGEAIYERGWLEKDEFMTICLWKSRRPKQLYLQNSAEEIVNITRRSLQEADELMKIKLLIELKGVRIPTASAILSVYNPRLYPIIDERCIQSLINLNIIEWSTITPSTWLTYLTIIRELAEQNGVTPRGLEKGLFAYNRIHLDKDFLNLYKSKRINYGTKNNIILPQDERLTGR